MKEEFEKQWKAQVGTAGDMQKMWNWVESMLKQHEEEMVKRLRHKIFDQGFVEERNGKKGITWSTRPTWTEVLGLIDTLKQHDK